MTMHNEHGGPHSVVALVRPGVARGEFKATPTRRDVPDHELSARIVAYAAATTVGQARVAQSLGVTKRLVWNWTRSKEPHEINLRQLLQADPRFARSVLVQALAHVEARLDPSPAIPAVIGIDRRARRLTVAHGRVLEAVDRALGDDGGVDHAEAAEIVRAAREERARIEALEQEVALAAGGMR